VANEKPPVKLTLTLPAGQQANYFEHLTIGHWNGQDYVTLKYPDLTLEHSHTFCLQPGNYRITATTRQIDGTASVAMHHITLSEDTALSLSLPADQTAQRLKNVPLSLPDGPVQQRLREDQAGIVIFADPGSEPTEHLLREMLKRNLPDSAFGSIHDPEVAAMAAKAGVGAKITCKLGGKTDNLHGEPIELTDAYVKCISDGKYLGLSPMGGGSVKHAGLTVLLVVGNVSIVVISARAQAMDDGYFRLVGLRHDLLKYAAIKSAQHFKGWWMGRCSGIVPCDSPGIHCADLHVFDFKYTNTNYFPLADTVWEDA
jgi:microcystin degradation protein MlrC